VGGVGGGAGGGWVGQKFPEFLKKLFKVFVQV
jgi:hypothetical protein